jgi:hypothetical protein
MRIEEIESTQFPIFCDNEIHIDSQWAKEELDKNTFKFIR